jgi:predicted CXXCH cytochrome family protein
MTVQVERRLLTTKRGRGQFEARWWQSEQQEEFPLFIARSPRRDPPTSRLAQWPRLVGRGVVSLLIAGVSVFAANSAPIDTFYDRSCTDAECHPSNLDDPSVISHPSFLEHWCDRCHLDHSSSEPMLLSKKPDELCLQCHTETETNEHGVLHPPDSSTCVTCHSPHQSSVPHLLRTEEQLLQCGQCHAQDLQEASERPFRHRFFNPQTECGTCHYAHREGQGRFVRANLGETCLTCHDMNIRMENRTLENVGSVIRQASVVHPPLAERACHVCHTPHGSLQSSLLREDYPGGSYAAYDSRNYQLCWSCHDSALVEAAETEASTGFRDGTRNLHSVHVLQSQRGRACHLCHSAHASERPHLIRSTMTFGTWTTEFDFQVLPDGGTCTTACHRPTEYNRSIP